MYGKLSDVVGRKMILYPSIAVFLVRFLNLFFLAVGSYSLPQLGSALCGAAKSMTWLIIARAVQGIGGGGMNHPAFPEIL